MTLMSRAAAGGAGRGAAARRLPPTGFGRLARQLPSVIRGLRRLARPVPKLRVAGPGPGAPSRASAGFRGLLSLSAAVRADPR